VSAEHFQQFSGFQPEERDGVVELTDASERGLEEGEGGLRNIRWKKNKTH
jgi:hypothetical protein